MALWGKYCPPENKLCFTFKLGCIQITDGKGKGFWTFSRESTSPAHCSIQRVCRGICVNGVGRGKNKAGKSTGNQMYHKCALGFVAEISKRWGLSSSVLWTVKKER